jgi:putative spermidine/putrescine transport system permease protein
MTIRRLYGWVLVGPAGLLLLGYFIAPLLYFLRYSVRPQSASGFAGSGFTAANFTAFFSDSFLVQALIRSALIAAAATIGTLVLTLPVAYYMLKARPWLKGLLVILAVFPLLTGSVVRSIGWVAILGYSGVMNEALTAVGVAHKPLDILQTSGSVTIVIISVVLPVMVLLLHASMESVDPATERAALSLGASRFRAFRQVLLPQITPGIVAGTSLVFVLSVNAYATPLLVGGSKVPMMAPQIYTTINSDGNLPGGAAMSAIVVVISLAIVGAYGWLMKRQFEGWRAVTR